MINKKEQDKLLHDIKGLALGIKLISGEENSQKREYLAKLLDVEIKRLVADIEELLENDRCK